MTRRRQIEHRRRNLEEIREIMASMRSLAYVEAQNVARQLDSQRAVVASMDAVASDFLSFHPDLLPPTRGGARVCIAIGSERGFCGDLNHAIARYLGTEPTGARAELFVLVGHKLHSLLGSDARVVARLPGAGTTEEIGAILHSIVAELGTLQRRNDVVLVSAAHVAVTGQIVVREILPPFGARHTRAPTFGSAPMLNVAPTRFLLDLTEHYVLAALHEILYAALMAESHRRITHLDGAIRHLDGETDRLGRRANALRQEEIIEEIEVILLGTIEDSPRSARSATRSP